VAEKELRVPCCVELVDSTNIQGKFSMIKHSVSKTANTTKAFPFK